MRKQYIVPIVILLLFAGAVASMYQFFFRPQLERYSANNKRVEEIRNRLKDLEKKFAGADNRPISPNVYVAEYKGAVQPWVEALNQRSAFFKMPVSYDPVPQGSVPKFYYREVFPKLFEELYAYAYNRGAYIPNTTFGVPVPADLDNRAAAASEVNSWLKRIAIGSEFVRFLVDSDITEIRAINIWQPYEESGMLRCQTIGVDFSATIDKLAGLLDKMYNADRYFNVDALRITNNALRVPYSPRLDVLLIITQAAYVDAAQAPPAGKVVTASAPKPGAGAAVSASAEPAKTSAAAPPPAAAAAVAAETAPPGPAAANDKMAALAAKMEKRIQKAMSGETPPPTRKKPWWAYIIPF